MNPPDIHCMIVDDEPLAIKVIESHLAKVPEVVVKATCQSAIDAYGILHQQNIDLIFLDIQMPELNGIDFINSLDNPPAIIFTTAHRDYALEGFELDVVDYLLKPVSLPRLLRAIDKYRRVRAENPIASGDNSGQDAFIMVRANRMTVRIPVSDICFIESLSDYVKIHTSTEVIVSKERISHLAEKLELQGFIRIHRSFLAATSKITSYTSEQIRIANHTLPISRSYRQEVKRTLGLH